MYNLVTSDQFVLVSLIWTVGIIAFVALMTNEVINDNKKTRERIDDWGKYFDEVWTDEPLTDAEKQAQEDLKPKD